LRLNKLKSKLKSGGFIAFASDIDDYFEAAHQLLELDPDLIIKQDDFTVPHLGYIQTKYHSKAIKENRAAQFIQAYLLEKK
jgi:tRNA G46 methylase TrmB